MPGASGYNYEAGQGRHFELERQSAHCWNAQGKKKKRLRGECWVVKRRRDKTKSAGGSSDRKACAHRAGCSWRRVGPENREIGRDKTSGFNGYVDESFCNGGLCGHKAGNCVSFCHPKCQNCLHAFLSISILLERTVQSLLPLLLCGHVGWFLWENSCQNLVALTK